MLVLSRQRDESIIIGDNIVLTVVDICGDKVKLGINAPFNVPVHRQEVYEAITREQGIEVAKDLFPKPSIRPVIAETPSSLENRIKELKKK